MSDLRRSGLLRKECGIRSETLHDVATVALHCRKHCADCNGRGYWRTKHIQRRKSTFDRLAVRTAGKSAEAEVAWRAIVEAHPNDAEAYAHIGLLEAHQAHYQEAISYDRRSLTNGD